MTSTDDCQLTTVNSAGSLRQRLGCWANERWRTELILRVPALASAVGQDWMDFHNRHESISKDPVTTGRICHWQDSAPLTVSRVFPAVGSRILKHCLERWPVLFEPQPNASSDTPEVSFVMGVRGTGRLPQFQATLASLLGQTDCRSEVIVVEQGWKQEFADIVPSNARYVFTPATHPEMPFNRSWALNVGAVNARGRVVVLHDGDYVVPTHFAREVSRTVSGDVESVRLPRFIFYLDPESSQKVQEQRSFSSIARLDRIVQNNPTPMALIRDAYMRIGGHDESFYGWGGEDNEFLDRARTLNHREGAFLPVFHLWHPEAPNRTGDRNADRLLQIMSRSPQERISLISSRAFGQHLPSVEWSWS